MTYDLLFLSSKLIMVFNFEHTYLKYKMKKISSLIKGRVQFFNAGCNEKVFLLNAEKKLDQIRFTVFEKNAKTSKFNSEKMTLPSRRLGYSNNQLKTVNRLKLKISFRLSETI